MRGLWSVRDGLLVACPLERDGLFQSVLECAGFPGLLGLPAFEPIRTQLLEGVELF